MRTATYLDLAPYRRSTVGFDRLFDLMNNATVEPGDSFPAFDIEKLGEDTYRITLAVPGFRPEEIEVEAQQNLLTVTGRKGDDEPQEGYLHRSIATRPFERRFQLADFVVVQSASLDNGLLSISLKREVPEAKKPRRIAISAPTQSNSEETSPEQLRA